MHGREIDCVVEKDDIVEHYGDANMLILAVVCREGGSRGLFRLAVPTPCHSCSSSDCLPFISSTHILLRMDCASRATKFCWRRTLWRVSASTSCDLTI